MPTLTKTTASATATIEVSSLRYLAARQRLLRVGLFFLLAYWLLVGWTLQQTWSRTQQHSLDNAQQASERLTDRVDLSLDLANAVFIASDITLEQVPDPYIVTVIVKPMAVATLHVFDSLVFNDPQGEHRLAIRPALAEGAELPACPAPPASLAAGHMQWAESAGLLLLRYKPQHGWTPDLWLCAKLRRSELNGFMHNIGGNTGLQMGLLDLDNGHLLGQSKGLRLSPDEAQIVALSAAQPAGPPHWLTLPGEQWLQGRQLLLNRLADQPLLVIVQVSNRALLSAWFEQIKWLVPLSLLLMLILVLAYIGSLRFVRALDFAATHDVLTQLYSRRHVLELALQVQSMAKRLHQHYALVLLDVDHFKTVNDRYGHAAGDAVLQGIAAALQQAGRKSDLVGRYGGEEFVVVLPATDPAGALLAAERLRLAVATRVFSVGEQVLPVTISLGYICDDGSQRLEDLLQAADQALYQAKAAGRNCVIQAATLKARS